MMQMDLVLAIFSWLLALGLLGSWVCLSTALGLDPTGRDDQSAWFREQGELV